MSTSPFLRSSSRSSLRPRQFLVAASAAACLSFVVLPRSAAGPSGDGSPAAANPNLHYYEPVQGTVRPEALSVDICVYGGTSAGVVAAVQAARQGNRVVLVAPEAHLGGLSSGGLTWTDFGNKASIGGVSREFYQRVGRKYGSAEEWRFEPKVAEQVFEEMVKEAGVPVRRRHFLASVRKQGPRMLSLTTERGLNVQAGMFIDATYEGDLMARAGVRYAVGREANSVYGETIDGVQLRDKHQFEHPVSPYQVEGDPRSGLLPGINPEPVASNGSGDRRVQAYCFRMTLTDAPANRIPFPKPPAYDEREYVLLARYLKAGWNGVFGKFDPIRGEKVDKNNHGATSTDYIGQNYAWPDGDYATRERIFRRHIVYQQGLMWFLANDPRVPDAVRTRMQQWGLCKDEFPDTGGWPYQLYIREARRMVADVVLTEHHCRGTQRVDDSVGLGAYGMDSHNCQRVVVDGRVMNEGDVQVGGSPPYPIAYRAIVPKRAECTNLLVPVCLSASHIAYGSIRMEPVFMVLGQSAAVAAGMGLRAGSAVQEVNVPELQAKLRELGQVLQWTPDLAAASPLGAVAPAPPLPGLVLDDTDSVRVGAWVPSARPAERRVGTGYVHDGNTAKAQLSITWKPEVPSAGEYEIFLIAPPHPNRASNVPVAVSVPGSAPQTVRVDMRREESNGFHSLGRFRLPKGRGTEVTVSNRDTDGFVVADGVQLLPR